MSEDYTTPHLKGLGPKFVQITGDNAGVYALDEQGQVWWMNTNKGRWDRCTEEREL